jgi:hypothetical protein
MRPVLAAQLSSLAIALAICAAPRAAHAIERQHHFGLDPSLSILKIDDKSTASVGAGLGLHYTYGLNDQFNFMAEGNVSIVARDQEQDTEGTPRTRPAEVAHVTAGVGYVIDVLRLVPYIGLLAGGYRLSGGTLGDALVLPGLELAAGLDYQLSRHWAVGLAGRQHMMVTKLGTYPSYTTVMLRFEYMWGF